MILTSKYAKTGTGVRYAPITTPNAVRWPDGSNLNDKLSAFDPVVIDVPLNTTDATEPVTELNCELGRYYRLDVPVETLAINLPIVTDLTTVKTIVIYLEGGTIPAITISSLNEDPIYYQGGFDGALGNIVTGDIFEINCMWNGKAWIIAGVDIETT